MTRPTLGVYSGHEGDQDDHHDGQVAGREDLLLNMAAESCLGNPGWVIQSGTGVYNTSTSSSRSNPSLVEPVSADITNITGRAELAAIAAAQLYMIIVILPQTASLHSIKLGNYCCK